MLTGKFENYDIKNTYTKGDCFGVIHIVKI